MQAPLLGFSEIFTFFFIMLGPLKLLAPFAVSTARLDPKSRASLAWQTAALAAVGLVAAAFVGRAILQKWHVSVGALLLAAGLILLLVALAVVLPSSGPPAPLEAGDPPSNASLRNRLFGALVSPYGTAFLIALMVLQPQTLVSIFAALFVVIAIDLLSMLYAGPILHWAGPVLQVLGAIMGVLQVALSIQIIAGALRFLVLGIGSN
jgi:multiple antibiotic resistance protein